MQEVAVGSYQAFIAASGALSTIGEQVSAIDNFLESLSLFVLGVCVDGGKQIWLLLVLLKVD